jgi:hypothetical protein
MSTQSLLEQAARAERLAGSILDTQTVEALKVYARECRERANSMATLECAIHKAPLTNDWAQ